MSEPQTDVGRSIDARELADRLILAHGELDPLELLLAADLLAYGDYEAWRLERRADIQSVLRAPLVEVLALLGQAQEYARGQGLAPRPLEHQAWGALGGSLEVGADPRLRAACSTRCERPSDRRQLDLFQDSAGLLLETEVRDALAARRPAAAMDAIERLAQRDPGNRHIGGFLRLAQAAEKASGPRIDAGDRPAERLAEIEALAPLAEDLLGRRARDLLAPLWTALAEHLEGRPFDPRRPRLHAAHCWAAAGRWEQARASLEGTPDWRRHPPLILDHAQACWHLRDIPAARGDWLALCWEHPEAAEERLGHGHLPDPHLSDLWDAFLDEDAEDGDLDSEDFPAWVLIHDPAWALPVDPALAPDEPHGEAFRLLHGLRRGAGEEIALRRALGETHPRLLALYLASRG